MMSASCNTGQWLPHVLEADGKSDSFVPEFTSHHVLYGMKNQAYILYLAEILRSGLQTKHFSMIYFYFGHLYTTFSVSKI